MRKTRLATNKITPPGMGVRTKIKKLTRVKITAIDVTINFNYHLL
jgi:hypothetical protein